MKAGLSVCQAAWSSASRLRHPVLGYETPNTSASLEAETDLLKVQTYMASLSWLALPPVLFAKSSAAAALVHSFNRSANMWWPGISPAFPDELAAPETASSKWCSLREQQAQPGHPGIRLRIVPEPPEEELSEDVTDAGSATAEDPVSAPAAAEQAGT